MTFDKCAILGWKLNPGEEKPFTGSAIEYETKFVGHVKITIPGYQKLFDPNFPDAIRFLIAGICKHRTLEKKEPVLIDDNFFTTGYKELNPPIDFDEKAYQFLKYLYKYGGKENRPFDLNSTSDFPLAYSSPEEFERIIDYLKTEHFIEIRKAHLLGRNGKMYMGVKVTRSGREEAEKALPKMPLFGLINQEITTGDFDTDEKINHARKLFFQEPVTMDNMRSACEALSYVLEPLRNDLATFFTTKDVSDFFQIVNTFDIRHNKIQTKALIHPEQLEWVFYSLLNTINTFTKLKSK